MTVHILISLLTLGLFCWTLSGLARAAPPRPPSWLPLAAMVVVLLPMTFGPIVPLSHFVFEATSDNVLWYIVVYGLLWLLASRLLWLCVKQPVGLVSATGLGLLWGILAFWYYLGATRSQYEPGVRTPAVTDASLSIAHWATVHLAILFLLIVLTFGRSYRRSWQRWAISALLWAAFLMITFAQFFG